MTARDDAMRMVATDVLVPLIFSLDRGFAALSVVAIDALPPLVALLGFDR